MSTTLTLKRPVPAQRMVPTAVAPSPATDAEFWFIWCRSEQRPKRRHPTIASARIEALRLRTIAPDKEFAIYRAQRVMAGEST